ncbi:MAG: RNA methyltransferase [Candidatus Paceibacterota bacterium]
MAQTVKKMIVVLVNIRSRENVGSIFRTADAVGVDKIYLCGITPMPPHDKISKTALGAEEYVSWEYHKQTARLLKKLRDEGLGLIALEQTTDAVNIFKLKTLGSRPIALIVGNEVKGLSPQILKYCDKKIAIPMYGKKESLNVAVAFGIAVYQLLK